MWCPDPGSLTRPKYKALAHALGEDIARGKLARGARLPTHRELADALGVTVGTVTRAYGEAEARGLIEGTVGRGTFVRSVSESRLRLLAVAAPGTLNLAMNRPASGPHGAELTRTLAAIASDPSVAPLLDYVTPAGLPSHRQAGARFFRELGTDVEADRVLVTCGAQGALSAVLTAVAEPGDAVLVEALTYPGILSAAAQRGLHAKPVAMDEHGMRADAFDTACRKWKPRAVVLVPNHHNPTGLVMPAERREAIARVARAHRVLVVEDDVYGFLVEERPPPVASFLPELTCTVTCTSKSLVPGLRIGYVAAPLAVVEAVSAAIRTAVWMAPPLMAEIAARWIEDGTAERLMDFQRVEARERQRLASDVLAPFGVPRDAAGLHLFLPLPGRWTAASFAAALAEHGVLVAPTAAFVPGDEPAPNAVRLSVCAPDTREDLARALGIVRQLLSGAPGSSRASVI